MPKKAHYHIITRVLVIAAVVAVLPLLVGFLLIEHSAKTRLTDAAGANAAWLAGQAASGVDRAFVRELEFLASVGRSPSITAALRRGDARSAPSEASTYLSGVKQTSALYRHVQLFDEDGTLVASSDPAELELERAGRAAGLQRPLARSLKSDRWVEIQKEPHAVLFHQRVASAGTEGTLGVLRAETVPERLFAAVSDLRIGDAGYACLFDRSSRALLAGRWADCAPDGHYPHSRDVERARTNGERYFLSRVEGPASFDRSEALLVAHAQPELVRGMPELDWVVTVEQPLAETHAPLASLSRDLVLHFLVMGALVVGLAAYVSFKLERPVTDVEMDLHHDLPPGAAASKA